MQKTIVNITSNLLSRLPVQQMYYSTSDLSDAGFPTSLIERIHLEIEANLAESVQLPQSDWADMQTDPVQDAWSNFLSAIRAETRLPSSFARSVIETSVEDLLDLLSTPRNFIISTLFRNNQTASFDELTLRSRWVVAFPQLTSALLRYMQKKQLNVIPREKAEYVIAQVDDKLTEGYTPLKWGQHLEIMFNLLNNEVPSALLASFFEDRGMVSEARALRRKSQTLSRSAFVDVLTGMSILDLEDENVENNPITLEEAFKSFTDVPDKVGDIERSFDLDIETTPVTESEQDPEEISIHQSVSHGITEEVVEKEEGELTEELYEEEVEESTEEISEEISEEEEVFTPTTNNRPRSILDAYLEVSEEVDDDLSDNDTDDADPFEPTLIHAIQDEVDDIPALYQSVQDETEEEPALFQSDNDENDDQPALFQAVQDENEEEPALIDASHDDEDIVIYLTAASKKLLSFLEPNLDLFIVEIFLNDELDFYKHLENISSYNNWRMAGRYITRDIFDRNRIDLYSETAVLFTDTVQEYFDQLEH